MTPILMHCAPSGTELSNGQAAKLAVKDMMDDRPRMYDSPPTTYTNRSSGGHFAKTHFHIQLFPSIQIPALGEALIYQRWSQVSMEFYTEGRGLTNFGIKMDSYNFF